MFFILPKLSIQQISDSLNFPKISFFSIKNPSHIYLIQHKAFALTSIWQISPILLSTSLAHLLSARGEQCRIVSYDQYSPAGVNTFWRDISCPFIRTAVYKDKVAFTQIHFQFLQLQTQGRQEKFASHKTIRTGVFTFAFHRVICMWNESIHIPCTFIQCHTGYFLKVRR